MSKTQDTINFEIKREIDSIKSKLIELEKERSKYQQQLNLLKERSKCKHNNVSVGGYIYTTVTCKDCDFYVTVVD